MTAINFLYWLFITISTSSNCSFVAKYLRITTSQNRKSKEEKAEDKSNEVKATEEREKREKDKKDMLMKDQNRWERFVTRGLRSDGVFLLRIIESSAGDILTADLIYGLYEKFVDEEMKRTAPDHIQSNVYPTMPVNV